MADLEEDVQITPNKISNTNCCIEFNIKPVKSKILLNPQNCVISHCEHQRAKISNFCLLTKFGLILDENRMLASPKFARF